VSFISDPIVHKFYSHLFSSSKSESNIIRPQLEKSSFYLANWGGSTRLFASRWKEIHFQKYRVFLEYWTIDTVQKTK